MAVTEFDPAKLAHRRQERPYYPTGLRALPRQTHGRHDDRGREQSRGDAIAAASRDRCDPKSSKSLSGSDGAGLKPPSLPQSSAGPPYVVGVSR